MNEPITERGWSCEEVQRRGREMASVRTAYIGVNVPLHHGGLPLNGRAHAHHRHATCDPRSRSRSAGARRRFPWLVAGSHRGVWCKIDHGTLSL